jgi:hypothetical protein
MRLLSCLPNRRHRNPAYTVHACANHKWRRIFRRLHATVYVVRGQIQGFPQDRCAEFYSSRQDSFIHRNKLFCSTCLLWGLWCPPYKSVEQDNIHGSWWRILPASVRAQDTFMSSLLYCVLSQATVFPAGSNEHSAVQGCTANAGYDAIYSLLRLHHP